MEIINSILGLVNALLLLYIAIKLTKGLKWKPLVSEVYKKVGAVMAYLCGDEFFIKENFNKKENKMNEIIINNVEVKFEVVKDEIFTNSLQIAEVFEKEHKNIIRIIESLPNDDFRRLNFELTERTAKFGAVTRSDPFYNLTRDGFSLLVMGFTGEKAYKWKIEYIKAFNKMEAMLREKLERKPINSLEILQATINSLVEQDKKVKALEGKTSDLHKEQLKAKHNINRLLNNDSYMTIIAYANLQGINAKAYNSSAKGRLATKLSKEQGALMGAVIDPRYGKINTYDVEILKQVF